MGGYAERYEPLRRMIKKVPVFLFGTTDDLIFFLSLPYFFPLVQLSFFSFGTIVVFSFGTIVLLLLWDNCPPFSLVQSSYFPLGQFESFHVFLWSIVVFVRIVSWLLFELLYLLYPQAKTEKNVSAVRETSVSRHNSYPIVVPPLTPQYNFSVIVRGVSKGAMNWVPHDAERC